MKSILLNYLVWCKWTKHFLRTKRSINNLFEKNSANENETIINMDIDLSGTDSNEDDKEGDENRLHSHRVINDLDDSMDVDRREESKEKSKTQPNRR
jgi:hypothetical protein